MRFVLIFLLVTTFSYGQKKEYFFDEDWKSISRDEFVKRTDYKINLPRVIESDTAVVGKLVLRNVYGTLTPENQIVLRDYLSEISGIVSDTSKIIIVNYYAGITDKHDLSFRKSKWNIYDKDYLKKLNEIGGSVHHYWIYNSDKDLVHHHSDRLKWIEDKSKLLQNLFFEFPFSYGSFAIIMPNGNYYVYHGEYGKQKVWESLTELLQKNAN